MNTNNINLVDTENAVRFDGDNAVFKRTQYIDPNFLANLADLRAETSSEYSKMGDMHLAASIPTVVVEQWMAEGFNIFDPNNKLEDIMKRLRQYDMENLIATNKRLY